MESKRIFVAIKITNTIQIQEIFRQVALDLGKDKIKWVRKDGLHITLLFVGNKQIDEITELINKLRKIGANYSAFKLNLEGMGAFPSSNSPRVLWIGVKANQILFDLQREIRDSLQEDRSGDSFTYTPHLTIGRIKGGVKDNKMVELALGKWKEWKDDELEIKEFVLMESILTEKGPEYKILETFILRNED